MLNAFGVAYRELGELERARRELPAGGGDPRSASATSAATPPPCATWRPSTPCAASTRRPRRSSTRRWRILERLGDRAGIADLYNDFGVLAEERGDYEEALDHYQQALRVRRDLGDDLALAAELRQRRLRLLPARALRRRHGLLAPGARPGREGRRPDRRRAGHPEPGPARAGAGRVGRAPPSPSSRRSTTSRELDMKDATAASLGHLGRLAQLPGPLRRRARLVRARRSRCCASSSDRRGLAEFTLAEAEVELELGAAGEAAGERLRAPRRCWIDEGGTASSAAELRAAARRAAPAARRARPPRGATCAAPSPRRAASHSVVGAARRRGSRPPARAGGARRRSRAGGRRGRGRGARPCRAAPARRRGAGAGGARRRRRRAAPRRRRAPASAIGGDAAATPASLPPAPAAGAARSSAQAAARRGRGASAQRGRAEVARLRRELPAEQRRLRRLAEVRTCRRASARRTTGDSADDPGRRGEPRRRTRCTTSSSGCAASPRENERLFQQLIEGERRFRGLAKAVWKVQEDERRRLARELHDGLGQTLTALTNQLERLQQKPDDGATPGELARAARRLGRDGAPGAATRPASCRACSARRCSTTSACRRRSPGSPARWSSAPGCASSSRSRGSTSACDPDLETLVFRVVQEALTNVLKHAGVDARARSPRRAARRLLALRVADRGARLRRRAPAAREASARLGPARHARPASSSSAAASSVASAPGEGTVVAAEIPLAGGATRTRAEGGA